MKVTDCSRLNETEVRHEDVGIIREEYLKAGSKRIIAWMLRILLLIWATNSVPGDWLKVVIIPRFKKGAGNKRWNCRDINLLSVVKCTLRSFFSVLSRWLILTRLIDLKATYDTVNRNGLWNIVQQYGPSKKIAWSS